MAAPSWCAKYIGIPYSDRGRGDDAVDCWGLAQRVLREQFGVIVPDYAEYYSTRRDAVRVGGRITSEISAGWTEIDKGLHGKVFIWAVGQQNQRLFQI